MNKVKIVLLMASMVLAVTFTFSCSSDDGDGGGTQGGVSSSSGGGGLSSSVLGGTSSSDGGEAKITKSKITGVSQKGPFVEGSTITLYELNDGLAQTGRSFKSIISDNKGSFEIRGVELISPYAMLEASGYYRNEVTGELSKGTITLFAIADMREKDNFNVNLLTHLEYYRVLNLAESGKSVAEAKKQAQKEILSVFGIDGDFKNSEDMSIFGATEGDAALLAISVLLQGDLSEGEFSQRLTNFAQSVKESGKWENETAKAAMADWVMGVSVNGNYCKYADLGPYQNGTNCWPMPTEDMCRSGTLVNSCPEPWPWSFMSISSIRNNILAWGLSSEVSDFEKYVINYWAMAYGLGGCGSANEGEVKKDNRNVYRICKSGNWAWASELEYVTYQWVCSTANEGEIKKGDVSNKDYICKYGIWREANYKYKYCFENDCKYFIDPRDNQRYTYVEIGQQTWMAENLNYEAEGSECYGNLDSNCDIYGRLYNWETAKTVCPSGWHLPSNAEWDVLMETVGGYSTAGTKLKAAIWWYNNDNGTDEYGFSALPGGMGFGGGGFDYVGDLGYWLSASEYDSDNAYGRCIGYYNEDVDYWCGIDKSVLVSVRCLQD